jgi:hypothetical protein
VAKTSETKELREFLSRAEAYFGPRAWIKRWIDTIHSGIPDSCAIVDSIFLPIEAKISKGGVKSILQHKFERCQIETMLEMKEAGGFPIGLIFKDDQERYILPEDIPESGQLSISHFESLPIFRWDDVINAGKIYVMRFRRKEV